jgi:3-mercaptopyruvate sulfurtransferase SseA
VRIGPGIVDPAVLSRDREIVLYDSDPDELVAEKAASDLIAAGYRVSVLQGGISAWMTAKLPTAAKTAPQPAAGPAAAAKA